MDDARAFATSIFSICPVADPAIAADRYWRSACLLAATHVFGLTWPPPGQPQRTRLVGHWGCNAGVSWIVAHLAAHWVRPDPIQLVVGTGHADSFAFAHEAMVSGHNSNEISDASAKYGQPGGEPTERVGAPMVPYLGGELGPALGVSQGLASATRRFVACIVGDGECETPAALSAFAHADVLLRPGDETLWLPVVNANGARMGSAARFSAEDLGRILQALGYRVIASQATASDAGQAAANAIAATLAGERVVWISISEKGPPAPKTLAQPEFFGARAHKPTRIDLADPVTLDTLTRWLGEHRPNELLGNDGQIRSDIRATATRVQLEIDAPEHRPSSPLVTTVHEEPDRCAWSSPMGAIDNVLAERGVLVASPDEAESNFLIETLRSGRTREVLAEALCAQWVWGLVEGGCEAAFITYEAFAPLTSTLLVQYGKMIHSRPPSGRPPFVVVQTSLGWANSPTHQNTDLVGTVLARPWSRMSLIAPIGRQSARRRMEELLNRSDFVGVLNCSKQPLLDAPDPGGPAVELTLQGARRAEGTLIAVGDVCVTEAIGAAVLAASADVSLRVIALVDLRAVEALAPLRLSRSAPIAAVAWCAPAFVEPLIARLSDRIVTTHGYKECWGPTAWETLCSNGMDRFSILETLQEGGLALDADLPALRSAASQRAAQAPGSVPEFDAPRLIARELSHP